MFWWGSGKRARVALCAGTIAGRYVAVYRAGTELASAELAADTFDTALALFRSAHPGAELVGLAPRACLAS